MNKGNIFREFLFSRLRFNSRIRENKNPAKISTYTVYDEKQFCHPQSHFKYPVIFFKKPYMKPTVSGYLQKLYDQTLEMTKSTPTCSTFHISLTHWYSRDSPTPISC